MARGGISNDEVINFFENVEDNDIKENFVGVFPSNYIDLFLFMKCRKIKSIHL